MVRIYPAGLLVAGTENQRFRWINLSFLTALMRKVEGKGNEEQ